MISVPIKLKPFLASHIINRNRPRERPIKFKVRIKPLSLKVNRAIKICNRVINNHRNLKILKGT